MPGGGPLTVRTATSGDAPATLALFRTGHFADIDSLWADAAWRRRGVAEGLLSALISWARDHPEKEQLGLFVLSTNAPAIRLHERYGFQVEGRYPRDVKFGDGSYADTVVMGLLVEDRTAASQV